MVNILGLVIGLILFLSGMKLLSRGLEKSAGKKLIYIIEKITANKYLAIFIGALITAIIQSSSATSIILISFLNSKLINLRQAIWVILGANIGTTITSQLIAINIGEYAIYLTVIGIILILINLKFKNNYMGEILFGLGILFIAMNLMSDSMKPLQDSEIFISLIISLKNPIIGILVGTIFTALIQSSSASIGVLQALSLQGIIPLSSSLNIIYGQNIGTCITALIASINGNRNAKRISVIHVLINVISVIVFIPICYYLPILNWVENLTPTNPAAQIANINTIYNIVSVIVLIPFDNLLMKLSFVALPKRYSEDNHGKLYY